MRTVSIILVLLCLTTTCVSFGIYRQSARYRVELQTATNELAALREQPVEPVPSEPIRVKPSPFPVESSKPAEEEVKSLQIRVVDLEKHLEQKDQLVLQLREQIRKKEAGEEQPRDRREPRNWAERARERMETLQEENPEEYARIVEERKAVQQRLIEGLENRLDLFSFIDTEGLSPEYLENHNALLERLNQLSERFADADIDPASEGGWSGHREMFRGFRDVGRMMDMERDILLNDFAVGLGFMDEDATSFVEYMDVVNEMTSPRAFFNGMRGRGR